MKTHKVTLNDVPFLLRRSEIMRNLCEYNVIPIINKLSNHLATVMRAAGPTRAPPTVANKCN